MEGYLPSHLYALDFTPAHYNQLLEQLSISSDEGLFKEKKGAIKKAIASYFARTYQSVDVDVAFKHCTITKHFADASRSESFDRMLHHNAGILLDIHHRREEYLLLPFLLSIPEDTRSLILKGFLNANEPMELARKLTREQITTIFGLNERDIIFFLRGRISVRYYTPPQKFPDGIDKRFAGESVENMEELYQKYFPQGAWGDIEPILGEVLAEKLNFSVIDNLTFARTFIPVFRSTIEILLLDIVAPEEREKIEGFTGFVLRKYFDKILLYSAKNLLDFVENRDKNAETFVKYFTEEVVLDGAGNKVQKYAIIDTKQQRWNYTSIVSIMMQFKQAKLRIASQKEVIVSAQDRVDECDKEIETEKVNKREVMDKIADIESKIAENDTDLLRYTNRTTDAADEQAINKSAVAKLNAHHNKLMGMKKSENNHLETINNRIANKISELSRRKKKLDYETKSLKMIQEQMAPVKESYGLIAQALASVLAKR